MKPTSNTVSTAEPSTNPKDNNNLDYLNEHATYPDLGNITAAELSRNIVQAVENLARASTAHEFAHWQHLATTWSQMQDMISRRNKERSAK